MFRVLFQAFELVPRRFRRRWMALAPLAAVSAFLEALAAAGILALIQLISDPQADHSRFLGVLRGALGGDNRTFLFRFALALGGFFVCKNLFRLAEAYIQHRVAADTGVAITAQLMQRYLEAPYAVHLRRNSADLVHLLTRQVGEVWLVLQAGVSMFSESLVALAVIAVLVVAAPWGAVAVALFLGAVLVGMLRLTYVWHGRWGWRLHDEGARFMKAVQEGLAGVKEIKALGRQSYFVERVREARERVAEPDVRRQASEHIPRLGVETVFVGGLALLIWSAAATGPGKSLAATLGLMAYAGLRLLPSIQLIIYRAERVSLGAAGVQSAYTDLKLPAEAESNGTVSFENGLAFRDVSFRYEGAERAALSGVNFELRKGESVGVVGPTGSGKSTLVDLALGLLQPTGGAIAVDGADLKGRERAWRLHVGYVPQSITLIDDTIRRNVALGGEQGD
ncbi:MAG: ABC transporter ATP-binding protein [Bryobacterales bacterium]